MNYKSWDIKDNEKTALTESQTDSVFELSKYINTRPYPNVPEEELAEPSFALKENYLSISSYSEFLKWYTSIEEDCIEQSTNSTIKLEHQLEERCNQCRGLLHEMSAALEALSHLRVQYTDVATKTNALHQACEHLLADQAKLVQRADAIDESLAYFNVYETITAKLSSSTLQINPETFLPILNQIDESLEFLRIHPDFKEASSYTARFRQCLAKALGFIQSAVSSAVQAAVDAVTSAAPPISTPSGGDSVSVATDNSFAVFYGRFRGHAGKVRPLTHLLEERLEHGAPEYTEVLVECRLLYLGKRELLLRPSVDAAIEELKTSYPRDHCAFVRAGCALMSHLCEDETTLYSQFFGTEQTQVEAVDAEVDMPLRELHQMTRRLCYCLYDAFRPLVIHMQHLETLAELCGILQNEMMAEISFVLSPVGGPGSTTSSISSDLSGFDWLCRAMLADLQERLVYRTHVYMRSEILGFKPVSGDLAYPEKLMMMREIAEGLRRGELSTQHQSVQQDEQSSGAAVFVNSSDETAQKNLSSSSTNMPLSPADLHGMWYPTVRRTLVCLSKLSRCLDKAAFQGLSQECLSYCVDSLCTAALTIQKDRQPIDGHLFLIKHLLILREQVAPFHMDFAVTETSLDFTKLKDAAYGLLSSKGRLLALNRNNALLQFLIDGTPNVIESVNDSRQRVDMQLKSACDKLIDHCTETLCAKIRDFVTKAQAIATMNQSPNSPQVSLRQQPFAAPERVHELVAEVYRVLKQNAPRLQDSLRLYLANPDTEHILFRPVKTKVLQAFKDFEDIISKYYSEEDREIVACPSIDQVTILLQSSRK